MVLIWLLLTSVFVYRVMSSSCVTYDNALILAFGDSLTHGTLSPLTKETHPYTLQLHKHLPSSTIIEKGVPGEVTSHMVERLKVELASLERAPDVIIILGGTNDIGMRIISPQRIVANIISMHEEIRMLKEKYPEKYGHVQRTVVLTIPR